ncbi:MAG: ArnT family glycosyltransferase [Bryobacteraceae bacterium]
MNPRLWRALVAALLLVQGARCLYTSWRETQTVDEGIHIASGYTFLKTGLYELDAEHPPLARVWFTLPLAALRADAKLGEESWKHRDMIEHGKQVLYRQPKWRAETLLFSARAMVVLLTLALTLAVALWTRARFGPVAGLSAAALVSFDPTLCAHGHYATTDMAAALMAFVAIIAFESALLHGGWRRIVLAGVATGAAFAVKLSMLFLAPCFVLLAAALHTGWRRSAAALLGTFVLAVLVAMLSYGPAGWRWRDLGRLDERVAEGGPVNTALRLAGEKWHVPAHPWLVGIGTHFHHQDEGHEAYLLGEIYKGGRWQYFPVAFLVKTPVGTLLLVALALPLLVVAPYRVWAALLIPLAVYWAGAVQSHVNIGVRHLLPVFPFTIVLAAGLMAAWGGRLYRRAAPVLLAGCCLLAAAESVRIFPHDIAFFNVAAGGPENGHRILLDSNIDWGQSLGEFIEWLGERPRNEVCLCYFGVVPLDYFGFDECGVIPDEEIRRGGRPERRWYAMSVTLLEGVYHKREWYGWLRARKPVAKIGYSIYVFDVSDIRKKPAWR